MIALALLIAASSPAAATCAYDRSILTLGIDAFDQDMNGGWRPLAATPGCTAKAADVLRYYRERVQSRTGTLYWHEGQLRAELSETDAATVLLRRAVIRPTKTAGTTTSTRP